MLLSVSARNSTEYGTLLEVWYVGGERKFVKRPFDPYFYSLIKIPKRRNEAVTFKDLATHEKLEMWKVSFPDTNSLKKVADPSYTTDDDIPYDQRVAIDEGYNYPSETPAHYAFDIEMHKRRITAVSFYNPKDKDVSAGNDERAHLHFLNEKIEESNTDLVDTYWGSYFDVIRVRERAKHHNIPLKWGREQSAPYIKKRRFKRGPRSGIEHIVRIRGRLHFDVWKEVNGDQTLSGIKDHRLQTVAEWFNFGEPTEYDHSRLMDYGWDVVASECLEDSKKTWLLAEMYLNRLYYFADTMHLPLNMLIERTPSHIPNYVYMRDMKKLGIIARENNNERYKQFFTYGRKAYQGAMVKLYNAGIYDIVRKADFKSMYPTIMYTLNLSPESVKLLSVEHLKCTGFEPPLFEDDTLGIYDSKVGLFKVQIAPEESISKKRIRTWMAEREKAKVMLRKDPKNPQLESWQYGLKVHLNKLYGYNGMRFARYGVAPIAADVTGIGRWWMWESVKWLREQERKVIEVDTDGAYYRGDGVAKELTAHIKSLMPERWDTSLIKVEDEKFDAGIFYEEKGYILKEGKKLLFHGSGLKGRHLPPICDYAAEELTTGIFEGKDPKEIVWKYARELKKYPLEDFVMTMQLHKEEYKDGTMQSEILKIGAKYDIEYEWGAEVRYVKCRQAYVPYHVARRFPHKYRIDYAYYRNRLASILARILGPTKHMGSKTLKMILKEGQSILC